MTEKQRSFSPLVVVVLLAVGVSGVVFRKEIGDWLSKADKVLPAVTQTAEAPAAAPAEEKAASAEAAPEPAPEPEQAASVEKEPEKEPEPEEAEAAPEPKESQAAEPAEPKVEEPAAETAEPQPAEAMEQQAEEQPATDQPATASEATEQAAAPAESAPQPEDATAAEPAKPAPVFPPVEEEQVESAEAPATSNLQADWSRARNAFWNKETEIAIEHYKALVAAYPDEADPAGELGNVLVSAGREDEAVEYFYEAGLRMMKGPNPMRADMVIMILSRLAPDKADTLRQKMFESMATENSQ